MDHAETLYQFRWHIAFALIGLVFLGLGIAFSFGSPFSQTQVEVLGEGSDGTGKLIAEIAGAVNEPGVYDMDEGARVEELITKAGGLKSDADTQWIARFLNRAEKLADGQKLYIPSATEHSETETAKFLGGDSGPDSSNGSPSQNFVNINTASQKELEYLWGIGPVTAQNIIEQRPYSKVEDLLDKGIVKQNVYDRNKDILTVY